jgi:hypothetical protein
MKKEIKTATKATNPIKGGNIMPKKSEKELPDEKRELVVGFPTKLKAKIGLVGKALDIGAEVQHRVGPFKVVEDIDDRYFRGQFSPQHSPVMLAKANCTIIRPKEAK